MTGTHRTVALAVEEYQRVAAANRNRLVATATVARELLTTADSDRLASALAGQYGRPVHLNVVVDPTIMGGVGWRSGTTSSTAPSPAAWTTPDAWSPADRTTDHRTTLTAPQLTAPIDHDPGETGMK